jgi:hypothetical protein
MPGLSKTEKAGENGVCRGSVCSVLARREQYPQFDPRVNHKLERKQHARGIFFQRIGKGTGE